MFDTFLSEVVVGISELRDAFDGIDAVYEWDDLKETYQQS